MARIFWMTVVKECRRCGVKLNCRVRCDESHDGQWECFSCNFDIELGGFAPNGAPVIVNRYNGVCRAAASAD